MTHQEVIAFLELWPGVRESVGYAGKLIGGRRGALAPAEAAFVHFAIQEDGGANREEADRFIASIIDGTDLSAGDPILALRHRLLDPRETQTRSYRRENNKRDRLALVLKAWILHRNGKRRKVLRFDESEPFPDLG
jgi:hypothetical protein